MSGTSESYHLTKEDIKKDQAAASKAHGGNVPKDSEAAALQVRTLRRDEKRSERTANKKSETQSIVDKAEQSKADIIAERQANLPLPDAPPVASDWNSNDARNVNVSTKEPTEGGLDVSDDPLRAPNAADSGVRAQDSRENPTVGFEGVGRQGEENLGGLPADAVARGAKDKAGLADTTNADYGYPQKNDPASK